MADLSSMSKRTRNESEDEEVSMKLYCHQRVLECPICFDPLSIPVFQCVNGHISCSSCHQRLKHKKCPTCSKKLGNQRNRAIESVVESIRVACSFRIYGCAEKIGYCDKRSHEETCVYAPYECPFTDCLFSGSPRNLYMHLKEQHASAVVTVSLNRYSQVPVSRADDFVVFLENEEGEDGAIFILDLKGKTMGISYIRQEPNNLSKGHVFGYSLHMDLDSGSFKSSFRVSSDAFPFRYDNATKEKTDGSNYPWKNFVNALDYSLCYEERIWLWLKLSSKDESSAHST